LRTHPRLVGRRLVAGVRDLPQALREARHLVMEDLRGRRGQRRAVLPGVEVDLGAVDGGPGAESGPQLAQLVGALLLHLVVGLPLALAEPGEEPGATDPVMPGEMGGTVAPPLALD